MIVPQSVSSSNDLLLVKINGEEYTYATDIVFEQNTRHKITVRVEPTSDLPGSKFNVTFSIKSWNNDDVDYGGSIVVGGESEWVLMTDSNGNPAKGKFRGNDLFSATGADPEVEIDVNVYEHKSRKGYYKVEKPWMLSAALGFGFPSVDEALAAGLGGFDTDFVIDATNPNQVVIEQQSIGVDVGYGEMFVLSGYPDYMDAASGTGTLVDGVITFPAKSCLLYIPAYNATSLFYANSNGKFRIVLPGYEFEPTPCDVGVVAARFSIIYPEYAQSYPDTNSMAFVIYGTDIKEVKFIYTPTAVINDYLAQGATLANLIIANDFNDGEDYIVDLDEVNSEDGWVSNAVSLNDGTEYTIAVWATNIYGESAVVTTTYTTDPIVSNSNSSIDSYEGENGTYAPTRTTTTRGNYRAFTEFPAPFSKSILNAKVQVNLRR